MMQGPYFTTKLVPEGIFFQGFKFNMTLFMTTGNSSPVVEWLER